MERLRIGPYLVSAELGSGGMGKVYRAEVVGKAPGLAPGSAVAIKVIHPHLMERAGFFKRFLREAEIGKSVRHPNVVRCIDCDAEVQEGRQLNYLVMEYVEGQTLRALLAELERVPEELCRHLGREVAKGLAAIHAAGVVHRDLKPENVLITRNHAVKVMDLGVARVAEETIRLSDAGDFIGTMEYAAPEQFRSGSSDVDGRADLYALGVMLYELSTARHPYRESDPRKLLRRVLEETPRKAGLINPQLSPFFEEVVAKLVAKDREDRFSSASDLVGILVEGERSDWWKAREQIIRVETNRPLRRIRIPRETAVYGRDEELAALQAVYERARAGEGQVLLIEGEAGIGKTRLVDEFVGRLQSAGEETNFLFGSYPPGGAATASGAWSTAYREHFGAEALEERLRPYLTITPILIPAFAALLRGEPPPEGKAPLSKDSLQTAFVHATRALAAERPTILLIEDLHFAPEEGRALFASLALAVPGHRILLIGTARPGLPEIWRANVERLEHARAMAVPRLGPKDLTRLLVDAFRSEHLAEKLSYKIAAKSDGNPFFVFEIIRGLREGQFITQRPDGSWITSKQIEHIQVPSSVTDLVKTRVAGLSEEDRELLDVASCVGFEFDPLLIADVAGVGHLPILKRLAQIERQHRLVRASGSNYVFDHHQVQEALYGSLSEPLRQAYHAAIGQALEARGSDDVVAICEHHLKGGVGKKALPHLDAALKRLEQGYVIERAIELMELALSVPGLLAGAERGNILIRECEHSSNCGRPAEARSAAEAALEIAEEVSDRSLETRALRCLGSLQREAGRFDEAAGSYAQALRVAQESENLSEVGEALFGAGQVACMQEKYQESRQLLDRALAIAMENGDRSLAAESYLGIASTLRAAGEYEEAISHGRQAVDLFRAIGDRSGEALAMDGIGATFLEQGRGIDACEWRERSLALCVESGNRRLEALTAGNLAGVYVLLGRRREALRLHERSLALAREMGSVLLECNEEINLGFLLVQESRFPEAAERFERGIVISREIGRQESEGYAWLGLGYAANGQGRWAEAQEDLDRALEFAGKLGNGRLADYARSALLAIHRQLGEFGKAMEQCERMTAEAGEGALARAWSVFARAEILLRVLGDLHGAEEGILAAQAASGELGDVALKRGVALCLARLRELSDDCRGAEESYRTLLQSARDDGHRGAIIGALLALGDFLSRRHAPEALALYDEAASIAEESGLREVVYAACMAAIARGEEAGTARRVLAGGEEKLELIERMEARFRLWQAYGDPMDLAEAKRSLQFLVDHAPEQYTQSMIENVPLHREIAEAHVPDSAPA